MAIFKKLYVGDPVATSGTRVFKKLATEEVTPSLPIWNGTDLTDTKWIIRSGWVAEAGYGVFDVSASRIMGVLSSQRVNSLYIGYAVDGVHETPYALPDSIVWDTSWSTEPLYAITSNNTAEYTFSFYGGTDATNPRLINWLLAYGELTSHRHMVGTWVYNETLDLDGLYAITPDVIEPALADGLPERHYYALDFVLPNAYLDGSDYPYSYLGITHYPKLGGGIEILFQYSNPREGDTMVSLASYIVDKGVPAWEYDSYRTTRIEKEPNNPELIAWIKANAKRAN